MPKNETTKNARRSVRLLIGLIFQFIQLLRDYALRQSKRVICYPDLP